MTKSICAGAALVACPAGALAQGGVPTTTVITHGFAASGSKGAWVEATARAVLARAGGDGTIYRYTDEAGGLARIEGVGSGSATHVVLVWNWDADSAGPAEGPNWGYAQAAGDALHAMLRSPAYAAGSAGPGDLVSGRAIHLIGHSRGACVMSEAALRLGVAGIVVDQMTSLDPHPVNGTLDARYDLDWGDPVPRRWANVTWADNYWRADGGGLINGLDFDGMPLDGTFNMQLSESTLNCCAYSLSHSDVHLWYFGTIDLAASASNGEQAITSQMRSSWWPQGASQVGFYRSTIAAGTRPSIPPGAVPDPALAPILHNGRFDAGSRAGWSLHGGTGATLESASGNWYARMAAARPRLTHNRAYVPAPPGAFRPLRLSLSLRRTGTAGSDDSIRIELQGVGEEVPVPVPGAAWPVPGLSAGFSQVSVDLPAAMCGQSALLHIVLDGGPSAVSSIVDVDDIAITVPPPRADLNGDLRVDGIDLGILIAAWGACGGCPPDITGDGTVNAVDLAILLAEWG